VGGDGLADSATAKSVRVRDGIPAVADGPFAEARKLRQGTGRRLPHRRLRQHGPGRRDSYPLAGRAVVGHGGTADPESRRPRDV